MGYGRQNITVSRVLPCYMIAQNQPEGIQGVFKRILNNGLRSRVSDDPPLAAPSPQPKPH